MKFIKRLKVLVRVSCDNFTILHDNVVFTPLIPIQLILLSNFGDLRTNLKLLQRYICNFITFFRSLSSEVSIEVLQNVAVSNYMRNLIESHGLAIVPVHFNTVHEQLFFNLTHLGNVFCIFDLEFLVHNLFRQSDKVLVNLFLFVAETVSGNNVDEVTRAGNLTTLGLSNLTIDTHTLCRRTLNEVMRLEERVEFNLFIKRQRFNMVNNLTNSTLSNNTTLCITLCNNLLLSRSLHNLLCILLHSNLLVRVLDSVLGGVGVLIHSYTFCKVV